MKGQNLFQIVLLGVLGTALLLSSSRVWADDTSQLKEQIQELRNQVNQLEAQRYADQGLDPFTQMMLMRQQMERNMRQAFVNTPTFNPRMDIKKTDKRYIITMDIPGMDKDKINVENKQGMLIISGERQSETENNNNQNQYYRQERSFGSFMQAIPLPEDVQKDKIEASYKNGVLTVTVARVKKEEKKQESERIMVK